jgi:ABC-2 type transport system permease protein
MKIFASIIRARFFMLLQYRGAAIGGLITQVFFGLIFVMVYEALFASSKTPQPMALHQVITYIWLNQALWAMLPLQPDGEIRQMMRTGNVAYELVRPFSLYWQWFARSLALRSAPTLLRALPMSLLAAVFFGLNAPASGASAAWFAVSVLVALVLSSAITVLLNATLFWTISGEGASLLAPTLIIALSGMNIPLPFYPDWLQPVLHFLPFRGLLDVPSRIYSGSITPVHAPLEIGSQLVWCVIFVIFGGLLVRRGARQLVVQGG